jgi:acyl-CoA thioesterase YciA
MSHTDIAGSIPAVRYSRGQVVTVAVNQFEFHQPVYVGDVVSFYAEIVRVGRTSITVKVEVYAERNPKNVECIKVTEATLTYVAIDEHRAPRVVGGEKRAEG